MPSQINSLNGVVNTSRGSRQMLPKALAVPVILLAALSAAGETAAQAPAKEGPLYPALCRPSNAKLEILSPNGWAIKLPPGQTAATVQYLIKVNPGTIDPRCAEHFPHWQPAGWTVKTLFGRANGEGQQQKGEFEFKNVADFTWQAGGTATLGAGEWVMLSQVVLPELGASKTVAFTIEQEEVSEPQKIAKADRRSPRKRGNGQGGGGEGGGGEADGGEAGGGGEGGAGAGGGGEGGGGPSQMLSDLLSKIPGPKEKGDKGDKGGDQAETAGSGADPAASDQSGNDAKDINGSKSAGLKFNPNLVKGNPNTLKVNPNVVKAVKVPINPNSAMKTTNTQKATRVSVRPAMVCSTRRVGTKLQRICRRS